MGTDFDDATTIEDDDPIGVACGGNPMRNKQRGLTAAKAFQLTQDVFFGFGVDTGKTVIEDQNRRMAD